MFGASGKFQATDLRGSAWIGKIMRYLRRSGAARDFAGLKQRLGGNLKHERVLISTPHAQEMQKRPPA
jgi:hypothetical protein